MLGEIGSEENIPAFIARAKDKSDPFRLMGFGHRVYKNADPRAKLMQKICAQVKIHSYSVESRIGPRRGFGFNSR